MGDITLIQVIAVTSTMLSIFGGFWGLFSKISNAAKESSIRETNQNNEIKNLKEDVKELEQFRKDQAAINVSNQNNFHQLTNELNLIKSDTHNIKDAGVEHKNNLSMLSNKLDELLLKLSVK